MTFFKTNHQTVYRTFGVTVIGRECWSDDEIKFLKLYQQSCLPDKHTKLTTEKNWKAIFNLFVKSLHSLFSFQYVYRNELGYPSDYCRRQKVIHIEDSASLHAQFRDLMQNKLREFGLLQSDLHHANELSVIVSTSKHGHQALHTDQNPLMCKSLLFTIPTSNDKQTFHIVKENILSMILKGQILIFLRNLFNLKYSLPKGKATLIYGQVLRMVYFQL